MGKHGEHRQCLVRVGFLQLSSKCPQWRPFCLLPVCVNPGSNWRVVELCLRQLKGNASVEALGSWLHGSGERGSLSCAPTFCSIFRNRC